MCNKTKRNPQGYAAASYLSGHTVDAVSPALDFVSDAAELQSWLEASFTSFHQIAELSFEEKITSSLIQQELDRLGVPYQARVAHTGVRATLGSGSPTVFLRADIDALPITEHASHVPRYFP